MNQNLDGLAVEDVERIFSDRQVRTLQDIHEEIGQHTIGIWIQTGYKKAVKEELPLYKFPEFVTDYIFQRYEMARGEKWIK